ncbi:MAG: DUF58 domain-containing protein [Chloroflexota bacterium]|nr:DUF58 domain-containing protein [Chloroflexota bacterium]
MPLLVAPLIGGVFAAIIIIPALPLVGASLRNYARTQSSEFSAGIHITPLYGYIAMTLVATAIVSLVVTSLTLALTIGIIVLYLLMISIHFLATTGGTPLCASGNHLRVVAGHTAQTYISITTKVTMPLQVSIRSSDPQAHIIPSCLLIDNEALTEFTVRPSLSGPRNIPIQASIVDPWGLFIIGQELMQVELSVIPRAKYAEWLAKKYLKENVAGSELSLSESWLPTHTKEYHQGVEYCGNRAYIPGDRLKDINWKYALKLPQLTVKQYSPDLHPPMILLVNITAEDIEQADIIAHSTITCALTAVHEKIAIAFGAYDGNRVIATTQLLGSRSTVTKALEIADSITTDAPKERYLAAPKISHLRKTTNQLEQVDTEPAKRLSALLRIESALMDKIASDHPLSTSLSRITQQVPPPANITVISARNHDIDALSVAIDHLNQRGYHLMDLPLDDKIPIKTTGKM